MSKSKHAANSRRKAKSSKKPRTKPQQKSAQPVGQTQAPESDSPYRPGSLYGTLFIEGNKDYIAKGDLIKRVAEMTGKSEKLVGFAFQVLKSKSHRSNKNRSTELTEGDKVKLITVRK